MRERLQERIARKEGRLDEYLETNHNKKVNSLKGKILGVHETPQQQKIGGEWQLKDLHGKKFGTDDLESHYYLLYFGSSLCPDVCPLTLMKMQKAQRILNRSNEGKQYIKVQTVFVTTNPEYDTPQRLVKYREQMFDDKLLIARADTNTQSSFLQMLKKFRVPVGLNEQETKEFEEYFDDKRKKKKSFSGRLFSKTQDPGAYLNDHSKVMYLMAPDNNFLAFYNLDLSEVELAS